MMTPSFAAALFWLSVVSCVVAEVAILRATLRLSRTSMPSAVGASQSPAVSLPRPRRALEVLWAVLPAVALALVLWGTWRAIEARGADQLHRDGMTHDSHAAPADAGARATIP